MIRLADGSNVNEYEADEFQRLQVISVLKIGNYKMTIPLFEVQNCTRQDQVEILQNLPNDELIGL